MSFFISRATIEDLDAIVPLFSGYRQFYRKQPNLEEETRFIEERLTNGDSVIFLARDSDTQRAVGFTQLFPMFSSVRMRRLWVLNDLFVDESTRGRGVAGTLMETAEKFAASTDAAGLELATERNNAAAQALYEKRSWARDEEFYHYAYTT